MVAPLTADVTASDWHTARRCSRSVMSLAGTSIAFTSWDWPAVVELHDLNARRMSKLRADRHHVVMDPLLRQLQLGCSG